MKKTITEVVRGIIDKAGHSGVSYPEFKAAAPQLRPQQFRHCLENELRKGFCYRAGNRHWPRFFAACVPQCIAEEVVTAEAEERSRLLKLSGFVINTPGRAESSVSAQIRELINKTGLNGLSPGEARAALPHVPKLKVKRLIEKQAERGRAIRAGSNQRVRYFGLEVSQEDANARVAALLEAEMQARRAKERERSRVKRSRQYAAKAPERKQKAEALRVSKAKEREQRAIERKEKEEARRLSSMQQKTARMNALADKYRGTAAPKETAKRVQIVGLETAPRIQCPPCRSRYEVDPATISGLSKLPLGVYAEPASRWAAVAIDRRAA